MRSRVAGASTSQNAAIAPGRLSAGMRASSSASNTPTPLALTSRSASRASSSACSTPVLGRRIDDDPGPVRVGNVAVLLPVVGVGLVKGDAVTVAPRAPARRRGNRWRRRSNRPRRGSTRKTRSTGSLRRRQLVGASRSRPRARQIASSSSTRCAQLCRASTVARPCAASEAAKSGSARNAARWRRIAVAVARDKKIVAGREQVLAVVPRRARPAGCRRRAPRRRGSSGCRATPSHRAGAGHARSFAPRRRLAARGNSADSRRSRCRRRRARPGPPADSARHAPAPTRPRSLTGSIRNSRQLRGALVVAPIADPDEIALARDFRDADGRRADRPPRAR